MGVLDIAAVQFSPTEDKGDNLDRIATFVSDACGRGARVVVFPEYSSAFVDPFDDRVHGLAEALDGPFVSGLTALARAHEVVIIAGMLERIEGEARVHNTLVAVSAAGPVARYRKVHLYDAFGQRESDQIAPGDPAEPAQVVDVDGLTIGLMTCYDLRFPESARRLMDVGAQVLVVPAEWVRGPLKEHQWMTLLQARAIENTAYLVAADHTPPIGVGHSAVIDPEGVVAASLGGREGMIIARIDPDHLDEVRRRNPALRLRRYGTTPLASPSEIA